MERKEVGRMKKVCRLCTWAKAGNLIAILIKVADSRREGQTLAAIGPPKPLESNGGAALPGAAYSVPISGTCGHEFVSPWRLISRVISHQTVVAFIAMAVTDSSCVYV